MSKAQVFKKSFIIGMNAFVLLPGITGCSNEKEVQKIESKKEETPDFIKKRLENMPKEETKEEIEKDFENTLNKWNQQLDSSFDKLAKKEGNINKIKDEIAQKFIIMTDFLFYDGSFSYQDGKQITLDEIGEKTKEKCELVYSTIDSKIESYWPGYKSDIEKKYQKGKGYVTDKASDLKLELLEKASDHMTEEQYEKTGKYWDMFKKQTKEDYENGKEVLKDLWKQTKDRTSEKYTNWKNEYEEKQKHSK